MPTFPRTRFPQWWLLVALLAACLSTPVATQSDRQQDLVERGRQFLSRLTLDPASDKAIFDAAGVKEAVTLLTAVMQEGQAESASAGDLVAMHRALDGLIEVYEIQGELLRASVLATVQNIAYRQEDNFVTALLASQRGLDLQQRSGELATIHIPWTHVAENLQSLGRLDEALTHFRKARELYPDPVNPRAAHLWRQIVQAELARGDRDAARRELAQLLHAARGAPRLFQARAYLAESDLLIDEERFTPALAALRSAKKAIDAEGPADEFGFEIASQLLTVVLASMRTMPYEEALALATTMDAEFAGLPIPIAPFARHAITVRRRLAGDIDPILREDAARLAQARAAGHVRAQIETLQSLSASFSASRSVTLQISHLMEALELERSTFLPSGLPATGASASSYVRMLNAVGHAHLRKQALAKAEQAFAEGRRLASAVADEATKRELATLVGEAILGSAEVAAIAGEPDEARATLLTARKGASGPSPGPARFDQADVLLQLARLERGMNERPADAAQYYAEAAAMFGARRDREREIAIRLELARFLATSTISGAPDRAREALGQVARAAHALRYADAEWRIDFIAGLLADSAGDAAGGVTLYRQAVGKLDRVRSGLSLSEQRQSFVDDEVVQELYQRLIAALVRQRRDDEAWEIVERQKGRVFLEALQGRRFPGAEGGLPSTVARVRDIEQQVLDLRVQLDPANREVLRGSRSPELLEHALDRLEERFAAERQQAALLNTRAGQAFSPAPITIKEVQRLLPAGTALLEYVWLRDSLAVFLVTRTRSVLLAWKADVDRLRTDIRQLRNLLSDPGDESGPAGALELRALLTSTSRVLIGRVVAALPAGVRHLIVVPSGPLVYLPFEALRTQGTYLIDRYAISYLPNASALEFLAADERPTPATKATLFLGAIGDQVIEGWVPLPGTLREIEAIGKAYPGATAVAGKAFTAPTVKEALVTFDQVHLATHGLVDEEAPLFSAFLTGTSPKQPSRVSLYEIPDLRLRARTVVLSACETGLGPLMRGDEVTSLTRMFLLAGASTVVSSLWQVSDDSTALLMEGFYKQRRLGASPSRAIRTSMIAVRRKYSHPFYWAPFVVTGAW